MTGRIETVSTKENPGSIRLSNGEVVIFDTWAILLYEAKSLTVGQLVTFDLRKGRPSRALNISLEKQHYTGHGSEKRPQGVRYLGFEQEGNIRAYRFDSPESEATQTVTVTVDLALFAKHQVGIQDGPALCLRMVTAEDWPPQQLAVTDQEMLDHVAQKPSRAKPASGRRNRRSAIANLPWRGTRPWSS